MELWNYHFSYEIILFLYLIFVIRDLEDVSYINLLSTFRLF